MKPSASGQNAFSRPRKGSAEEVAQGRSVTGNDHPVRILGPESLAIGSTTVGVPGFGNLYAVGAEIFGINFRIGGAIFADTHQFGIFRGIAGGYGIAATTCQQ